MAKSKKAQFKGLAVEIPPRQQHKIKPPENIKTKKTLTPKTTPKVKPSKRSDPGTKATEISPKPNTKH